MKKVYNLLIKWLCNTNCSFCNFYEAKWNINEDEHYKELIEEINWIDYQKIDTINIWIFWYEPTMYKYFFEILDYIKLKWFIIYLTTNWVKLANIDFTKRLSKYISEVFITIYSSNDKEHRILTQNDDSYKIKLFAIENCISNKIYVDVSLLLLKPTLYSLKSIINQISWFFDNIYFIKKISLMVPTSKMWYNRNKALIPPYTGIIKTIEKLFIQDINKYKKDKIYFQINWIIPKCLYENINNNNLLDDLILLEVDKIITKLEIKNEYIYLDKCGICSYKKNCNWIEKSYIDVYWSDEFEKWINIDDNYSFDLVEFFLQKAIKDYQTNWVWFTFEHIDNGIDNLKNDLLIINWFMNYNIMEALMLDNKINLIRLVNKENNDLFIIKIINKDKKYDFSIYEYNNKNNIKIYYLFIFILKKKFSIEIN